MPEASITVSLLGRKLDAKGIAADLEMSSVLKTAVGVFAIALEELQCQSPGDLK